MDHTRIARETIRHHGVLLPDVLAAAGVTARQQQWRVRTGEWRRLECGILVLAGVPETVGMLATAALARLPHGALSHDTAGWVHNVEVVDESCLHVVVEAGTNSRCRGVTVHRAPMPASDVTRRHGFRVTTLERTLVDLGLTMTQRDLKRAVEGRLIAQATTFERLERAFARLGGRGRPGTARTGKGLALVDGNPPSESALEAEFLDVMERAGLPLPAMQVTIDGVTGEQGRVDGFYAEQGVIIELDGRRFHARIEAFERDRRRDQQAIRRGLRPLRFTHRQVMKTPKEVVEVLQDVLAL